MIWDVYISYIFKEEDEGHEIQNNLRSGEEGEREREHTHIVGQFVEQWFNI